MGCMAHLIALVMSGVVLTNCSSCCNSTFGELTAEFTTAYIGQVTNLTCRLKESYMLISNASVNDLYFARNPCSDETCRLKDSTIILVNRSTAVLQHKVSVKDNDNAVSCYLHGEEEPIGQLELQVEYSPRNVTNFSCIYLNIDKLNCSWDHPVNYLHQNNMFTTFEWRTDGKKFDICPQKQNLLTHCGNITNNIHGMYTYFRINVTDKLTNLTASKQISFYFMELQYKYGKPGRLEGLRCVNRSTSSVEFHWDSYPRVLYYVRHNSTTGSITVETDKNMIVVENLDTFTSYKFEVLTRYKKYIKGTPIGIPSDPAVLYVSTLQDFASSPPEVTEGGFTIDSCESELRNITVYWKNFDAMQTNGPIIKYEVVFNFTEGESVSYMVNKSYQSQFTLTNIAYNQSGHVTVMAGTEVGMSEQSLPIFIPKASEFIKHPVILLEKINWNKDKFSMLVSWANHISAQPTGYTVYWCERKLGCQSPIAWMNIPSTTSEHIVENLEQSKKYLFGVSMQTASLSSGFSWEGCYYLRNRVPDKPITNRLQRSSKTSITVVWSRPQCDELSPFIKYYILNWCPVFKNGDNCYKVENWTEEYRRTGNILSYTIKNLDSETWYAVWLQAVSAVGKTVGDKNYSAPIDSTWTLHVGTDEESEEDSYTITAIVIIVIAVLMLTFFWAVNRYRTNIYNECCKPSDIVLPTIKVFAKDAPEEIVETKKTIGLDDNVALTVPETQLFINLPTDNGYVKVSDFKKLREKSHLDYLKITDICQPDINENEIPQDVHRDIKPKDDEYDDTLTAVPGIVEDAVSHNLLISVPRPGDDASSDHELISNSQKRNYVTSNDVLDIDRMSVPYSFHNMKCADSVAISKRNSYEMPRKKDVYVKRWSLTDLKIFRKGERSDCCNNVEISIYDNDILRPSSQSTFRNLSLVSTSKRSPCITHTQNQHSRSCH